MDFITGGRGTVLGYIDRHDTKQTFFSGGPLLETVLRRFFFGRNRHETAIDHQVFVLLVSVARVRIS